MIMKKSIYLLVICTITLIVSCSKDDDNVNDNNVLNGTTWAMQDQLYQSFFGGICYNYLKFTSNTQYTNYVTKNGVIDYYPSQGCYKLYYPDSIILYKSDGSRYVKLNFRSSTEIVDGGLRDFIKQE